MLLPFTRGVIGHVTYTICEGLSDENRSADIVVILGNKVNPDGTLSKRLLKRLERGIDIYKAKLATILVVSGALGKEGHYEANVMKKHIITSVEMLYL